MSDGDWGNGRDNGRCGRVVDENKVGQCQRYRARDRDHHQKMVDFLAKMREDNSLCDLCLRVEGAEEAIKVHKMVIAAYSGTYRDSIRDVEELTLRHTSHSAVECVVAFLYGDDLNLSFANVEPVWNAACQLDLKMILRLCIDFLRDCGQSPDNVLIAMCISERLRLKDVFDLMYKHLCENFVAVSQTRRFMQCNKDRARDILNDDNLCVNSEIDVFRAAVGWIDCQRERRLPYAGELISCVRLWHLKPSEVALHIECDGYKWLYQGNSCVRDVVSEAYRFLALRDDPSSDFANFYNLETVKPPRRCLAKEMDQGGC